MLKKTKKLSKLLFLSKRIIKTKTSSQTNSKSPIPNKTVKPNLFQEENSSQKIAQPQDYQQQTLIKIIQPFFELPTLYTGGKIIIDEEDQSIFALCKFEIWNFDMKNYQIKKKILHANEEILNFAIHFPKKLLISFTRNNLFRLQSLEQLSLIKLLKMPVFIAHQMEFDSTGEFIILSSIQGLVKIYTVKHQIQIHEFKVQGQINEIMFHPQSQKLQLFFGGEDCCFRIYDLVIKKSLKSIKFDQEISCFTLDTDGKFAFIVTYDKLLTGINLSNFSKAFSFQLSEEILSINYLNKQGEKILILGGESGIPLIFNITDLANISQQKLLEFATHKIMKIFVLNKLKNVGILTSEQNLTLIQSENLSLDKHLVLNNDEIISLSFNHNLSKNQNEIEKEFIVFATNSSLLKVLRTDNNNNYKFDFLIGHSNIILSVVTIDNLIISSSKDLSIKLWELSSSGFQLICTFCGHTEPAAALAISKQKILLSGSKDLNIKLWDLRLALSQAKKNKGPFKIDQAQRTIIAHTKDINALAISHNSKLFGSASQDKTIKVWDLNSFTTKLILQGHKRGVWDISFSSFEKILASGSADTTIKLWNLVDGTCINTLEGHSSSVLKLSWISQGLQLISGIEYY